MLRVAIDIGGTFTDVVAETPEGFTTTKILTSADSPEQAALRGVDELLRSLYKDYTDITGIVHGTTLATNALIERRGAKTAFVTTAGFRDVLEMRYEKRFDQYALNIEMPEPIVPRPLRLGLNERILANGHVAQTPSDAEIDELAENLRAEDVEAVAIGFLHSYKNPDHEAYVAERLHKQMRNDVSICQSSEVAGEICEYERFSSVCANAYVRPLMTRYLGQLKSQIQKKGCAASFLVMLSDGALTTLDQATKFPIRLVEGGPAGGVALAAHVAREIGSEKTLSLDVGGTTAKICFIENGEPKTSRQFEVARAWNDVKGSGLPVNVSTVELVEIGAGGGSIATIDRLGRLRIGPKSAGAEPGPAAYNRGGKAATVTDAHLTVGNIDPQGFANGIIELVPERATAAIAKHVQSPLSMDNVAFAASGIIELADETMANAARVHGIEQGLDVSGFDLLVSGGGGGLHGARIAEKLGINRIIVPQDAGVGSAVGFLRSPVAFEIAITVVEPLSEIDHIHLSNRIESTLATIREIVEKAVPPNRIGNTVKAELRYKGQGLELSFSLFVERDLSAQLKELGDDFRQSYQNLFGFVLTDIPVELVSITVKASEQRDFQQTATKRADTQHARPKTRLIYSSDVHEKLSYQVVRRDTLNGQTLSGPVVVSEPQTTTLVRPGWSVHKSEQGHLILERNSS